MDSVKQPRFNGGVDEVSVMAGMNTEESSADIQREQKTLADVNTKGNADNGEIQKENSQNGGIQQKDGNKLEIGPVVGKSDKTDKIGKINRYIRNE